MQSHIITAHSSPAFTVNPTSGSTQRFSTTPPPPQHEDPQDLLDTKEELQTTSRLGFPSAAYLTSRTSQLKVDEEDKAAVKKGGDTQFKQRQSAIIPGAGLRPTTDALFPAAPRRPFIIGGGYGKVEKANAWKVTSVVLHVVSVACLVTAFVGMFLFPPAALAVGAVPILVAVGLSLGIVNWCFIPPSLCAPRSPISPTIDSFPADRGSESEATRFMMHALKFTGSMCLIAAIATAFFPPTWIASMTLLAVGISLWLARLLLGLCARV